ncbi:MAG TPA: hypothetical protein VEU47_03230 [Candidatus Cybelea sp.]|nr:hypothetical protein [Candidatus Cybelea sp.]
MGPALRRQEIELMTRCSIRKSTVATFAAWLLLTGCAGANTQVSGAYFESLYDPGMVRVAAGRGSIPVMVRGVAAGTPGGAAAVANAMTMPGWVGQGHFVASGTTAETYRVVLVFGAAAVAGGTQRTCADSDDAAIPAGGDFGRVQATFCVGRRMASTLVAAGPPISDPADPAMRELMNQVVINLLPAHNPGSAKGGGAGGGGM